MVATGQSGFTTDLTVTRVRFENNRAATFGGGLYGDFYSTVNVSYSVFEGNEAEVGGALCSCGSDTVVSESLVRGNSADSGGGIALRNGFLLVANTTVTENSATIEEGGLHLPFGRGTVAHATIVGNQAPTTGGIGAGGAVVVRNSVIANNPGGDCAVNGSSGNWDSDGSMWSSSAP